MNGMVAGRDPVESDPRPSVVVAEFGEAADPDRGRRQTGC